MINYKNLSRRKLLSLAANSSAATALSFLVPRVEAAEADGNNIHRYSYWFEFVHPKKNIVFENMPTGYNNGASGNLVFRNRYTALNNPIINSKMILMNSVKRPSGDGGDGPHPSGAAGTSGFRGGGKGKWNKNTTTLDQVLARDDDVGGQTIIRDLRAGFENYGKDGDYDKSMSVVNGVPQLRTTDPIQMYDRLMGLFMDSGAAGNGSASALAARRRSVFDFADSAMKRLNQRISHLDRQRVEAHESAIRDIEVEIGSIINSGSMGCEGVSVDPELKSGAALYYPVYSKLLARAFACDITRIAGMHYGSVACRIRYSHLDSYKGNGSNAGNGQGHYYHNATHGKHSGGDYLRDVLEFRAQKVAEYLLELESIEEPNGRTLLDNTAFWWSNDVIGDHDSNGRSLTLLAGGTDMYRGHGQMIGAAAVTNDILASASAYMGKPVAKFGSYGGSKLPAAVFNG